MKLVIVIFCSFGFLNYTYAKKPSWAGKGKHKQEVKDSENNYSDSAEGSLDEVKGRAGKKGKYKNKNKRKNKNKQMNEDDDNELDRSKNKPHKKEKKNKQKNNKDEQSNSSEAGDDSENSAEHRKDGEKRWGKKGHHPQEEKMREKHSEKKKGFWSRFFGG